MDSAQGTARPVMEDIATPEAFCDGSSEAQLLNANVL